MSLPRRRRKLPPSEPKPGAAAPAAEPHVARALRARLRRALLERESHRQVIEYLNDHAAPGP